MLAAKGGGFGKQIEDGYAQPVWTRRRLRENRAGNGAAGAPCRHVGIGIGGNRRRKAAVMAKEALMESIDIHELKALAGAQNKIEEMRPELFAEKWNQLVLCRQV
jgi:tartrate dehydratase alpha subunit/fumarate hydratase class I-like protein